VEAGKIFRRVMKERLETELQGKRSEIRNGVFRGRGLYDGTFVLRQATMYKENCRIIFGVYGFEEDV
jgi:hypothetical protein